MAVFVDTSAFIAVIDRDQPQHQAAGAFLEQSVTTGHARLVTSALVVVESTALIQARLGLDLAVAFHDDLLPLVDVRAVDERLLSEGVLSWRAARRRRLSLVDCVSFALMRRDGMRVAFSFDRDFQEEGFSLVPL